MATYRHPHGGVLVVPDELTAQYDARPGWERVADPSTAVDGDDVLKGKALDAALDEAGLPKTGSADEKRQQLAEYLADHEES